MYGQNKFVNIAGPDRMLQCAVDSIETSINCSRFISGILEMEIEAGEATGPEVEALSAAEAESSALVPAFVLLVS